MTPIEKVIELLEEIALGQGAYSMDKLRHAENCIKSMKNLAQEALEILVVDKQ